LDILIRRCLWAGNYAAAVAQNVDDGKHAGVAGTPVFLINGRLISGAQPLEIFSKLIEDALAQGRW